MLRRLFQQPLVLALGLVASTLVVVALIDGEADAKPAASVEDAPAPSASTAPPETAPIREADKHFTGSVREVLFAGSYVYVEVELEGGETRWVVGTDDPPRVGERVEVSAYGERRDFHSRRLDRDFARLLFGQFAPA